MTGACSEYVRANSKVGAKRSPRFIPRRCAHSVVTRGRVNQ